MRQGDLFVKRWGTPAFKLGRREKGVERPIPGFGARCLSGAQSTGRAAAVPPEAPP